MPKYPFIQVDAFTETPLAGNACAILFETDEMDDTTMLAVAKETNLPETVFVREPANADFAVRYFTPAEEIPLAGHPTIATTHALIETGRLRLHDDYTKIQLQLKVGPIAIEIYRETGKVNRIVMTQKKPVFLRKYDAADIAPVFGITKNDILPDVPIQTVSTGTPQLMVPVRNQAALRRIALDIPAYDSLKAKSDFFSPHVFCLEGFSADAATFARHFGTPPDILEDPFTGSATGGMASYLWHYGLIEQSKFIAEQGHWMQRPGRACVEIIGPRDNIESVKIGGRAVTVLTGEMVI